MTESAGWWSRTEDFVSNHAPPDAGSVPSATYRLGDHFLVIESDQADLLDVLDQWYSECRVDDSSLPDCQCARWSVRRLDHPRLLRVTFHGPAPFDDVFAASVFQQLHRSTHTVVPHTDGWRLIFTSPNAVRPFMAAREFDALIDLDEAPRDILLHYLISAMMSLQKDLLFVHAASVDIDGSGILIWGRGGAGKTTTSLTLASRGHAFLGDNMACIRRGSRELLPFRRAAAIKPGVRSQAVDARLRAGRFATVDLPDGGQATLLPVAQASSSTQSVAVPLAAMFYLRGFAAQPALEEFAPNAADQAFLNRVSGDPMAVFGTSPARRVMNFFVLMQILSHVRCYYLDVGPPEATARLIEQTVENH